LNKILITGGAGYIGSHTIVDLIDKGFEIVSIDNFSNAKPVVFDGIKQLTGVDVFNYNIDLLDLEKLDAVFKAHEFQGIIHFAAFKSVGESCEKPLDYFKNNINGLINVLEMQKKYTVKNFIFSSSCSIYGNPTSVPVTENSPMLEAASPYARTKQIGEQILKDTSVAHPTFNYISLRYFNPGGNHPSGIVREDPAKVAENLIPIIVEVLEGKREQLYVHGNDYPTRDGTCVRDYIYIMDLANAHTKSIEFLLKSDKKGTFEVFNIGTGKGVTVMEMIKFLEAYSIPKLKK